MTQEWFESADLEKKSPQTKSEIPASQDQLNLSEWSYLSHLGVLLASLRILGQHDLIPAELVCVFPLSFYFSFR